MIKVTILMQPVAKARPRTVQHGGKTMTYTPAKSAHAENLIRDKVMELEMYYPKPAALMLEATFYRAEPKKLPKGVTKPITRPDWDNYAKGLTDALNGFAFEDDSQITTAVIKKRFGYPPRIELTIIEDENT